jgi:hypothetical protein
MELFSDEVAKIKGLLKDWKLHPEIELEATFGAKGQVDMQTFLRVVSRLKAKGYESISQQDRLTIKLPEDIRFTISGAGHVAQYCRDNRILGKPFIAVIKDSKITAEQLNSATIDINDYDVRVKGRREVEPNPDVVQQLIQPELWEKKLKYFRLIRRWTFKIPGLKFDLSMVRSTQETRPRFAWQRRFQDQRLISAYPTYELEVELDRSYFKDMDTDEAVEKAFKTLLSGVGEILRGIQGNSILIRNSTREKVLADYQALTHTDRFRGVAPVTLETKNITEDIGEEPNIRSDYNVTDKADGLRVMAFTNEEGELFMIDMALNVYRTGLAKKDCRLSLLDGEYITSDKKGKAAQALLFFDIYIDTDGVDVSKKPFKIDGDCRFDDMDAWIKTWNKEGGPTRLLKSATLNVGVKKFFFADQQKSIFEQASSVLKLDDIRFYKTDGLIFTPNALGLPDRPGAGFLEQFKWKPSEDNTVDFLVVTVKDETNPLEDKVAIEIHPETGETIEYKTLQLLVGSSDEPAYRDPRATILFELPLPGAYISGRDKRPRYKAVPFIPKDFPDPKAAICNLKIYEDPKTKEQFVMTERTEQPIRDLSIVEMRYDATKPSGWRWIPIRVRADKTERLFKGIKGEQKADDPTRLLRLKLERTLNSEKTAESIWNSIHDPITQHMITTGSEVPSAQEKIEMNLQEKPIVKKYYEKKSTEDDKRKVKQLHDFHNKYIKDTLLYATIGKNSPSPKLLDLAVGRANDLHRWRRINSSFVLGVDATGACCLDATDGGYRRLLDTIVSSKSMPKPLPIPPIFLVIGDSSKRLLDGSAGESDEERDMLRSILGRVNPIGAIPPAVQKNGAGALKDGADAMTCMYALHYFFESPEKLNGLLQNIADNLKVGGLFVGTNFDGEAVFNLLRTTEQGKPYTGIDGDKILWEITKYYNQDEFPIDDSAFGMAIDVNFISIGLTHKEYLVPWELLVDKMKTVGCELLNDEELKALGLQNSSAMYETSYDMAIKNRENKERFAMNPIAKQYSFLNRWYIFKRTSQGTGEIGKVLAEIIPEEEKTVLVEDGVAVVREGEDFGEEEEVIETEEIKAMKNMTLKELSLIAQNSGKTPGSIMNTLAPAVKVNAAKIMDTELNIAKAAGNTEKLKELDEQATIIRGYDTTDVSKPEMEPGESAQAFVDEFSMTAPVPKSKRLVATKTDKAAKKYKAADVVKFDEKSTKDIKNLDLPENYTAYAGRHLAPNAPFRIVDPNDPSQTQYPSITHFIAAMKFKYATSKPEYASIFEIEGPIHKQYRAARVAKTKGKTAKPLTKEDHNKLLLQETDDVEKEALDKLNESGINFDETRWVAKKDELLTSAIRQRLTQDKWFCIIVSAALTQKKYLLYDVDNSELGGKRNPKTDKIEGLNKYGEFIMQLANDLPDELKACMTLPDTVAV